VRLAVLGDPIDHSLSPSLHRAALAAAGIPGTYETLRVDDAGFAAAAEDIRAGRLDGANVTMPHKGRAYRAADICAPGARRARAVNHLSRVGDRIAGHNTDIAGIQIAWRQAGLPAGSALILGAGGAAAAALLALEGRPLHLSARRADSAAELVASVGVDCEVVPWGAGMPGATLVNATPLGMHGESLPAETMAGIAGLFDMAYGRDDTPAVTTALRRGIPVAAGPDMLIGQAAESFRLWTGREPDLRAMRAGLAAERERRR
jgi:shikimate dehydrogenase